MDAELKIVTPIQQPTVDADRAREELEQANAQLAAALRDAGQTSRPYAAAGAGDILRQTQTERDRLTAENAELQAVVADLRGRVDYLETALASTEGSFSWRVTKPIRSIKSALKR